MIYINDDEQLRTDIGYIPNYFYLKNNVIIENCFIDLFKTLFNDITISEYNLIIHQIKYELNDLIYPVKLTGMVITDNNIFCDCQIYHYLNENDLHPIELGKFSINFKLNVPLNLFTCSNNIFKLFANFFANHLNNSNRHYYHNIEHVENMIKNLNKIQPDLSDYNYRLLYLTVCFHDAYYVAGADNETVAINTVETILYNGHLINFDEFAEIRNLINSTRIGTKKEILKELPLADILHDLDYFGFSTDDSGTGRIYTESIQVVPTIFEFNSKRIKFLESLLIDSDFFISKFYKHLSDKALNNIKKEIKQIKTLEKRYSYGK